MMIFDVGIEICKRMGLQSATGHRVEDSLPSGKKRAMYFKGYRMPNSVNRVKSYASNPSQSNRSIVVLDRLQACGNVTTITGIEGATANSTLNSVSNTSDVLSSY